MVLLKSKIAIFITMIVCILFQSTVNQYISLAGTTPNILVIFVVAMGLIRGKKSGILIGFFTGLIIDLLFGSVIGFDAFVYMTVGYIAGFGAKYFYDDDLKVAVTMVAGSDLLYNIMCYGFLFLLKGKIDFGQYFIWVILPEVFYTMIATAFTYKIFYFVNKHFMGIKEKESESIWIIK